MMQPNKAEIPHLKLQGSNRLHNNSKGYNFINP